MMTVIEGVCASLFAGVPTSGAPSAARVEDWAVVDF
jgi:hypothetical protein